MSCTTCSSWSRWAATPAGCAVGSGGGRGPFALSEWSLSDAPPVLPQADRFVAQHTAFAYFWVTCGLYLASPRMAYNLMEQIEEHAFQTYDEFLTTHGEELKQQPVPAVAAAYYNAADAYLFDEFQTGAQPGTRRPELQNLFDVFVAIRDDEGQHVSTMQNCQRGGGAMHSPHVSAAAAADGQLPASDSAEVCAGVVDCAVSNPTGWPSGAGKQ
jgi:ubiquinol oxidase